MTIHASRRDVLKGSGALVVSFSFAGALDAASAQGATAKPLALTEVDSFLAIDPKGLVTVYSGKVDLGTGVATALPQIVADELDVPLNMIRLVQGDTALTPDQGQTWGSLSVQIGGMQLRNAAATARAALLEEAAKRLGVSKEELKVADGVVSAGGKRISYGALIGGKSFALKLDPAKPAVSKDPKDFRFVGKPVPRVDIPDKMTGRFTYMQDFRVPGMLHGRVVRPPAFGAKLESVVKETERTRPVPTLRTADPEEIEKFMEDAIANGCEGLVVKDLEGVYRAGAREFSWVKLKREYRSELTDTIDLVVVGAFHGRGRRAGTYGTYLLAAYDDKEANFPTVSKIGTGFTDEDLRKFPRLLKKYESRVKPPNVKSKMVPDVWFRPHLVIETIASEITLSPIHPAGMGRIRKESGLALRFPKFTGKIRDDKKPEDATTVDEIVEMYNLQLKKVERVAQ